MLKIYLTLYYQQIINKNPNEDEKIKKSLLSPAHDAGGSVLCLGCFCTDHHQWSGERRHGRGCYRCLHCCQGNVKWYGDRLRRKLHTEVSVWCQACDYLHWLHTPGGGCQGRHAGDAERRRCPAQRGCRCRLWLYGQEGNLQLCGSDFQGSVQPGCRQRRYGTGSW